MLWASYHSTKFRGMRWARGVTESSLFGGWLWSLKKVKTFGLISITPDRWHRSDKGHSRRSIVLRRLAESFHSSNAVLSINFMEFHLSIGMLINGECVHNGCLDFYCASKSCTNSIFRLIGPAGKRGRGRSWPVTVDTDLMCGVTP